MRCRCGWPEGCTPWSAAGRLPALARLYPPHPAPPGEVLWREVAAALGEVGDELEPWLDRPPQTNEVARAAALMAGLLVVTARTGLPLALYKLGASAGLNLLLDRYAYRLGPLLTGSGASAVRLAPIWQGSPPPETAVRIDGRRGVDLHPVDVTSPAGRERAAGLHLGGSAGTPGAHRGSHRHRGCRPAASGSG